LSILRNGTAGRACGRLRGPQRVSTHSRRPWCPG